jgi:hypothetical protein
MKVVPANESAPAFEVMQKALNDTASPSAISVIIVSRCVLEDYSCTPLAPAGPISIPQYASAFSKSSWDMVME